MASEDGTRTGGLDGRIAVVTGGGRGIGAAIARALAAHGASVAIIDLADASDTVAAIAAAGGTAQAFRADLSVEREVDAVAAAVHAALGPIDILVNDAAVNHNGGFDETDSETYHRVLAINLHSQFYTCKAFVPDMRAKRAGCGIATVALRCLPQPSPIWRVSARAHPSRHADRHNRVGRKRACSWSATGIARLRQPTARIPTRGRPPPRWKPTRDPGHQFCSPSPDRP